MLMKLDSFQFDEEKFRGHLCAEFGWYNGEIDNISQALQAGTKSSVMKHS